jgi:type VI secretion system secreted protein VgrG
MIIDNKQRFLQVTGPGLPASLVVKSLVVHDGLAKPMMMRLTLIVDVKSLDLERLQGQAISLTLHSQGQADRYFHGIVYEVREQKQSQIELRLGTWLEKLKLSPHARIFENMTALQIVEQILKEQGCGDYEVKAIWGSLPVLAYCTQYQESDFHFITRLLVEFGIYWHVRHEPERHILCFSNRNELLTRHKESIQFLNERVSQCFVSYQDPPLTLEHSEFLDVANYRVEKTKREWRQQAHQAALQKVLANNDNWHLAAGLIVHRAGTSRSLYPKEHFVITDIIHTVYEPSTEAQLAYRNQLTLLPSHVPYRAQVRQKKQSMPLQVATVMLESDNTAAVVVKFDWEKGPFNRHYRVKVASPWAQAGYGMQFLPRKGTRVLVDFLYGDADKPVVIGCLYDAQGALPYNPLQFPHRNGIRSQSSGGNELYFDDTPGQECISLHAANDLIVDVKEDQHTRVQGEQQITVKNGDFKVRVEQGECEISSSQCIRLRAGATLLELRPDSMVLVSEKISMDNV